MSSVRTQVLDVFREIGREVQPDNSGSLVDQGILDSLNILELVAGLEDKFGVEFDDETMTLTSFDNLASIERLIVDNHGSAA